MKYLLNILAGSFIVFISCNDMSSGNNNKSDGGYLDDTTPPTLSNPQPTGTLSSCTTSTAISLDTDETATCKYSTTAGIIYDSMPHTFSSTSSTSHSTTVSGLEDGNAYTYYVKCQDEAGNYNPVDFTIAFSTCPVSTDNTLRIHPTNSRYFTDGSGKAIYLTGSHTWYNIHYTNTNPQMSHNDFEDYLNWMQSHGNNFTRLWTGWANKYPDPWIRTGPGDALDGRGLKFDMTNFDQTYFDLVRQRVQQVKNHGMYCSIMFYGSLIFTRTGGWSNAAWHPGNNINSELADAFDINDGHTFFTTNTAALNIQKAFVRKIIDTLNDFDHIIWEIANEAPILESINWQNGMVNYVRNYEASKSIQHLVGITSDGKDSTSYLVDGPGDWLSPDSHQDNYNDGGPANYRDKIVIVDTDHLSPWYYLQEAYVEEVRKWVWKTFTRGNHPILMDPYNAVNVAQGYDGTINTAFDPAREAMGYTLSYANQIDDLSLMIPSDNTSYCSTNYCLRNPGNEYLIYQPNSGSFTVYLLSGTYNYEWFSPQTGNIVETGSIIGDDNNQSFTPPFSGDAVLYLLIDDV